MGKSLFNMILFVVNNCAISLKKTCCYFLINTIQYKIHLLPLVTFW